MTKIDSLRRLLLPCFCPSPASSGGGGGGGGAAAPLTSTATKKRLSTSLRDDNHPQEDPNDKESSPSPSPSSSPAAESFFFFFYPAATSFLPRPSKSMVIGTIFGPRRGHVWFCIQHNRLSFKPLILLEFPLLIHQLVSEMRFGVVRIALECDASDLGSCPLQSVPVWTMFCNGRKLGFAGRRRATDRVKSMLKTMSSTTVGAGVMPAGLGSEEVMYMRANYEHVVGSADSESFHLINPDEYCPSQELSVFLLRSRNGVSR